MPAPKKPTGLRVSSAVECQPVADEESDALDDNDAELEVNNLEGFMNDLYAVIEAAKGTSDGTEGGDELACPYENVEHVD